MVIARAAEGPRSTAKMNYRGIRSYSLWQVVSTVQRRLNVIKVCCLLALVVSSAAGSIHGQGGGMAGLFKEKELEYSSKPQTQLTVYVQIEGNIVTGDFSVDEMVNGVRQGQGDIWRIPFSGRLEGVRARVKYNPAVTSRGPDRDLAYKPPTDGTKPGVATLTLKGGDTLVWNWVSGAKIKGVSARVFLRRVNRRRK